jgi:DNA-binding IclR family transcriptional regulator
LTIIDALFPRGETETVGFKELAARLELHKSAAHRLLMVCYRVVERDARRGGYRLGLRHFKPGAIAIALFNIRD